MAHQFGSELVLAPCTPRFYLVAPDDGEVDVNIRWLLAAALMATPATSAAAQQYAPQPGPFARIVTITPKPGAASAFDEGYARHIEWHRVQRDPWHWLGWSFVLGPRLGQFMDGTFGHAAADFDHAVDPAGDGADNAANVTPHADFTSHGVYRRLDSLSRGPVVPDTSAYLVLVTYRVAPGRAADFEAGLAKREGRVAGGGLVALTWYRLELGGTGPEYLLMLGASGWESAISALRHVDPFGRVPGAVVESVTTELLRYRPTHSHHPGRGHGPSRQSGRAPQHRRRAVPPASRGDRRGSASPRRSGAADTRAGPATATVPHYRDGGVYPALG